MQAQIKENINITLRVTGLYEGNSSVTGEFPTQRASNAEKVPISWRHHEMHIQKAVLFLSYFVDNDEEQSTANTFSFRRCTDVVSYYKICGYMCGFLSTQRHLDDLIEATSNQHQASYIIGFVSGFHSKSHPKISHE